MPPSLEELQNRLKKRGQDSDEVIKKRMEKAKREISHYNEYDYLIVNDVFDESVLALRSIVLAHRYELKRQSDKHKQLLDAMLEGYSE